LKDSNEADNVQGLMLKLLQNLKTISDHPLLLSYKLRNWDVDTLIEKSNKLKKTIQLLEEIKQKEEKVIVFADRKETQELLQKVIYHTFGFIPSRINGDTPTTKKDEENSKKSRQQTIDIYQATAGFNVIVMSPIAAGVGLNVTGANHVIHYSRHWNPAKEQQATDRAYRIGQVKPVYVHYPISISPNFKSFEITLDELLNNKSSVASSTLFPTEQMEVNVRDVFNGIDVKPNGGRTQKKLTENEIDELSDFLFEAYVGCLYLNDYQVELTQRSGDRGADLVLTSKLKNYLVQVKHTKKKNSNAAIQEVVAAKKYYENERQVDFNLIVITNGDFTSFAKELAFSNNVKLISRNELLKMNEQCFVTHKMVHELDALRKVR